ncbi:hypothetical protein LIA77_10773 [Sarocladium implicatum]|nr:hypothetical protein LIA77_10773 [Sarocladium implicatum]
MLVVYSTSTQPLIVDESDEVHPIEGTIMNHLTSAEQPATRDQCIVKSISNQPSVSSQVSGHIVFKADFKPS